MGEERDMTSEPPKARRFRRGDVVRSDDGRLGVVVMVNVQRGFPPERVELYLDMPDEGIGIRSPELLTLSNGAASVAEARRLGLRGLG